MEIATEAMAAGFTTTFSVTGGLRSLCLGDLYVAQAQVGELSEICGLLGRVLGCDLAKIGQDIALQHAALRARGRDFGHLRFGDILLVQELDDGGVERIGGVLGLRSGGRLEAFE